VELLGEILRARLEPNMISYGAAMLAC